MTFFPAVMITAYVGGFWPGLLATLLGAVAANYLIPQHFPSVQVTPEHQVAALILFVLVGAIISGLCESLHRARRRILADERQRAEEALLDSEKRFRNLLFGLPAAVYTTDRQGRITFFNDLAVALWGCRPDPGQDLWCGPWRLFEPDGTPVAREQCSVTVALQEGQAVRHHEILVERSDGTRRCVLAHVEPLRDASRQIVGAFHMLVDITERKKAEDTLRGSEERFRGTFENAAVGIAHTDLEGCWLRVNEKFCAILGYTREELLQKSWRDITHPEDVSASLEQLEPLLEGDVPSYVMEKRYRRKDGSVAWADLAASLQRDGAGTPAYVIAVIQDISERKRLENELRESEHRWRSLTEALPQLVWSALPDGACDYFSTQWTQHTGVPEGRLLGWQWLEVLHPSDREPTRRFWTDSVAGRGPYDVEYRVRRSDGVYRWFKTRGVPIRDCAGRIVKWFGTCTDITDVKCAEEEQRLAREAAESANRSKDEFLANVSHEIRTPMNAILGMTELVLDTALTEDQRQCLKTVKSAADSLLGIINDLLDFSRIEAGKMELDFADFSLRSAVGDTLRALAVRAHTQGLELVCHMQPDVPDALIGDAGRLRQVLLNLVGNALKFTERGEVVVCVGVISHQSSVISADKKARPSSLMTDDCSLITLHFTVSDTGIGIPPDKQERIFRAFEQEDTSTTRKYGGTGLGLTIASRLIALMGGTITVNSAPGRGSTFAFTARFGQQPHLPESEPASPPVLLHDLPVLVVDDNATNRRILEEWLRHWRMKPVTVGDGVAAMDALWHGTSCGRPYPLVLLDARMPDVDGLKLAAQIRQRAELAATRIILLTSGDRPGDLARSREQRVNAHLLKPVQQEELLQVIYRVLQKDEGGRMRDEGRESSPQSPVSFLTPLPSSLRILVAEDNEFNAQLFEQLLVRRGHRVRLAANGREALAQAEAGGFDLLLLDVHMPELDGFQVVRALRERERSTGGHLPVIALTARSRQEDREQCLAAGMDDFLSKPVRAPDLWAAFDRVVGSRSQESGVNSSLTPDSCPLTPDHGLIDPTVLLAACGGDDDILEKLARAFRLGLPAHLRAVQDALRDRDAPRLSEAAHKLAGMMGAFSTAAGAVASDLEDQADRGELEEAGPLVKRLVTMSEELLRQAEGLSIESLRHKGA
jgi:PAS domain S-box-containing protein